MGWNSWNTFTWNINEQLIRETADALVETGLKEAGYEYVVVDDCWSLKQRDADGRLQADPEKFPNGMKAVGDYLHSKGLKFGMYSCAGQRTCASPARTAASGMRQPRARSAATVSSATAALRSWCAPSSGSAYSVLR